MLNSPVKPSKSDTNENFTRQGSLRKVLQSNYNKELFARQNEDQLKLYRKIRQEYIILAEFTKLQSENLQGIYVIPSKESSFKWFGVIFVRRGLYEDGIFRFNIILPDNFPDGGHPRVVFESEIFHPVIHKENNELHLLDGFPAWNKENQHIWQVLKYIHWVFHNLNASVEHGVCMEAVDMYKNNLEAFKDRVKQCVQVSNERVYDVPPDEDKHYIIFDKYIPEKHDSTRQAMMRPVEEDRVLTVGPSWVQANSFKALTRPPSPDLEVES